MTSLDLAHRIESVELSHGPLRPLYVSNYLEPADPSLCEPVCGLASCPRTASSGERVPPDWTSVRMRIHEARADKDASACWSSWLALAEGEALDLCDVHGQQRAAFVGRGQELRFKRKHLKQNRSVFFGSVEQSGVCLAFGHVSGAKISSVANAC